MISRPSRNKLEEALETTSEAAEGEVVNVVEEVGEVTEAIEVEGEEGVALQTVGVDSVRTRGTATVVGKEVAVEL